MMAEFTVLIERLSVVGSENDHRMFESFRWDRVKKTSDITIDTEYFLVVFEAVLGCDLRARILQSIPIG